MTLSASELERELADLRSMIHHLSPPLNNRPGLFLEQKDALDRHVEGLQRRLGFRPTSSRSFSAPQRDYGAPVVVLGGRRIPIERRKVPSKVTAICFR